MITYVRVRNLAIVEEVVLEPESGLNVLTGETGAGKSLLIDSLQFLNGARGSSEQVRTDEEKLSAEAVFQIPRGTRKRLEEMGIEFDSEELIVKREMTTAGRGRVLLNGSVVAVRELNASLEGLLEIHGQNESPERIAGTGFREMLDIFSGNDGAVERTREFYAAWRQTAANLQELLKAEKDRLQRADLLKYQIDEITKAGLEAGEEEALRSERAILVNARQIGEAAAGASALLSEDDEAALTRITRSLQLLDPLARSIEELRPIRDELEEIRIRLEECVRDLSRFGGSVRQDPVRLDHIEERLAIIERLKKKYGTVADILSLLTRIEAEHAQLQDYEASISKLQRLEEQAERAYREAATEFSRRRRDAAPRLQKAIQKELSDLAMEKTRVSIAISDSADSPHGFDRVEFLIAPNAGEELRPMSRIASGGELSRIQLAMAAALFKKMERPIESATLVFDEIDAGIGGRVAEVVGRKLRELAQKHQIICVTHLPQIAAFGHTHFRVWKEEAKGRTRARIEKLQSRDQRIHEIARMLAGEKISASALTHAQELLESGGDAPAARKRAAASAV